MASSSATLPKKSSRTSSVFRSSTIVSATASKTATPSSVRIVWETTFLTLSRLLVAPVARPGPEEAVRRQPQQREPRQDARAPGVEQPVGAGEGQHGHRQRSIEGEPDVRVERLDVEPVLAIRPRHEQ